MTRRVLTNGSIYMDLVQLTDGQKFLLSLPDEALPEGSGLNADGTAAGSARHVRAGFRRSTTPSCARWPSS